eukprot:GHVU01104871.1.p1 GENE.GHVU01104871.1~~GHVU01104871.1.p1  ORF type:complete len:125 (-),score=12.14 GHVU01104871.1:24-398(-)
MLCLPLRHTNPHPLQGRRRPPSAAEDLTLNEQRTDNDEVGASQCQSVASAYTRATTSNSFGHLIRSREKDASRERRSPHSLFPSFLPSFHPFIHPTNYLAAPTDTPTDRPTNRPTGQSVASSSR